MKESDLKKVIIYTDGGCVSNPVLGGTNFWNVAGISQGLFLCCQYPRPCDTVKKRSKSI